MDKKCTQLWQRLSATLKSQVSADSFKRWFSAVELVEASDKSLTFCVPNNIYQFWIESNYMAALQNAIIMTLGGPRGINFSSPSGEPAVQKPVEDAATLQEFLPESRRDSKATSVAGLNPRNTFESFVVGPNNEIAHAASLAVAQTPARTYNPLFMYGGVGLGKTHLMQAIGQYVWTKKKNTKVMYLSSELFINEFIDAIQHSTLVKFRKRYRQADVLLIDDIQFLGGKERSQDEVFEFIANRIRSNVRRLEGALMRVASFASLSGKELTQEVVEHLLKDILQEEGRHSITIEQIQRRVAEHFDVRVADMTSKRRPASIAFPRQVAMFLARELTKASLNEIGDAFGGRDHGTVLHACKLVKKRMAEQDNLRQTISFIDSSLQR